jgi:hypothetical protein
MSEPRRHLNETNRLTLETQQWANPARRIALWTQTVQLWMFMDVGQLIRKCVWSIGAISWSVEKIKQAIRPSRQINRNEYINTCSWWREISRNLHHRTPAVAYLSTNVEGLPRVSVMLSIRHRTVSTPICTRLTGQRGHLTQGSTSERFYCPVLNITFMTDV